MKFFAFVPLMLVANIASAAVVATNANVVAWNVGSGQSNGAFATTTASTPFADVNIELGLRAQERFVGAITPDGGNSRSYTVPTGGTSTRAAFNLDFSAALTGNISALPNALPTGFSLTLTVLNDLGTSVALDLLTPANLATRPTGSLEIAPGYVQLANSWNPMFGFIFGSGWDNQNFDFVYAKLEASYDGETASTDICMHAQGQDATCGQRITSQVPLPGTLALLGLGLIGLASRRTRLTK
jgi:hypothetical protein